MSNEKESQLGIRGNGDIHAAAPLDMIYQSFETLSDNSSEDERDSLDCSVR